MEEIDLSELLKYFWNKKAIMIFITLLALAIGLTYTSFIQKPVYQSYTTVLLTTEETSITYNDVNLNKNLIDTYNEIIKSKKIMKQVIKNLELDYETDKLIKEIKVDSVNDTEIIKITVTDENGAVAKNIANEIAKVFNKEIYNYYSIQNIEVLDEAEVSLVPSNINVLKQIVLSIIIGIVFSFIFVFVLYYFDTTVKTSEEIEKTLVLPVLGTIPDVGGKYERK